MSHSIKSLILAISALSVGLAFVEAAPVQNQNNMEKRIVIGSILDGCPLGTYSNNGRCVALNTCLFTSTSATGALDAIVNVGNIANLKLDLNKVLDITSNTCLSVDSCLLVKSNTIISHTLGGIIDVRLCQKKTCPHISILDIDTGICACPLGTLFADNSKKLCIKKSECSPRLNHIIDGVCIPKVCATGQILLTGAVDASLIAKVGSCVDASLCHVVSNGLCTTLKADVDIALHAAAGLLGNVKASVDGKVDVKLGLWA